MFLKEDSSYPVSALLCAGQDGQKREGLVMTKYLITSRHEPADCIRALDEELAMGPGILEKFVYGCKEGDHTGYAIVDVKNLSDALAMVPGFLQECACVTKVDKFTPAEIRSLHAKAA